MASPLTENFTEIVSEEAFLPLVEKQAQTFLSLYHLFKMMETLAAGNFMRTSPRKRTIWRVFG